MKRLISSSVMVLATLAIVVGGTGAFFSDTETSEGNVFTAGAIDLMVNHTAATYNGFNCETCGVELYSGDGQNEVVGGTNTELSSFSFPAEVVADPNENWATHPTADWIWASDTTLAGDDGSNGNDTTYEFERTFNWNGTVGNVDFSLDVGADNEYIVYLNGTQVGSGGGYSSIDSTLFSDNLQNGANTLTFEVTNNYNQNFPNSNNPQDNPGGLLYYISIERDDCSIQDLPDYMSEYQAYCELWESKDLTSESFFDFSDLKPQDEGTNLVSLTVEDNESYMCLNVTNQENEENNLISPEDEAGDDSANEGELGQFLNVMGWYADSNGDTSGSLFGPTAANDLGAIAYADSTTGNGTVTPGDTNYVKLGWCMGEMTDEGNGDYSCDGNVVDINQAQTDEFLADLEFHAVQSRNNDDFSCAEYFGSGTSTPGEGPGCTEEADVMLVLDNSGSVSGDIGALRTAANNFVNALQPSSGGVEIGVVNFNTSASIAQSLTGDESDITTTISNINATGNTNLDGGITKGQEALDAGRSGVDKYMIVITDGQPNRSLDEDGNTTQAGDHEQDAADAASVAQSAGTTMFAIGVGTGVTSSYLEDSIATDPELYFQADNFDDLQAEFDEILTCDAT